MSNDRPIERPARRSRAAPAGDRAPQPERQVAFRLGISAESRAAAYLVAKGFRILARRWRSPVGEIDIIARRRQLLVFVEVKAREKFDDAAWSVTDRQRAASSRPPRPGLPARATMISRTCDSMPCWWCRAASHAIYRRRSMRAASPKRVACEPCRNHVEL
jgi:hypothetical protein